MRRAASLLLLLAVSAVVCAGQSLSRYDFGTAVFSLYNPASSADGILFASQGNTLAALGRYDFTDSDFNGVSPFEAEFQYRHSGRNGVFSVGSTYEGYSYGRIHQLYGRYSRSIDLGDDRFLSVGGGLNLNCYGIDYDSLVYDFGVEGLHYSTRPDLDLGVEYLVGRFRAGMTLRNVLSLGVFASGMKVVRNPRALLFNFSYDVNLGSDWSFTPFAVVGSNLGLMADLGVAFSWAEKFMASYMLRLPDLREVVSASYNVCDWFSIGASTCFSFLRSPSISLLTTINF